jgi:Icc-related predicted phosphoesterase
VKIVALSDTHGGHFSIDIPDGDILVHAGDITRHGTLDEIKGFNSFLAQLPHRYKIVVAGNHDICFEKDPQKSRELMTSCYYLQDQSIEIEGLKFYGSPWQPWFYDWAFNLPRGTALKEKWDMIPDDTDVLITHGPPKGIGDRTGQGEQTGCEELLPVVTRVKPIVHIFGHIHEGYGEYEQNSIKFVNASICDQYYELANGAIEFSI